ncbi:MAG: NUDIX domain-containing protein [Planctomycetota bacterium]|nr:MAG: NUDIX domain-containing protein [Planctomycetota bacterium]
MVAPLWCETMSAAAAALLADLRAYRPFDERERRHVERTIELLIATPRPLDRTNPAGGHVTASAVVWSREHDAILTVYHRKLDAWFQPGGHVEPDVDASVAAAALRELLEETHLTLDDVKLVENRPFDVDVHPIPAWKRQPAHDHHDIRYLFFLASPLCPPPRDDVRWMHPADLPADAGGSMHRIAEKLRRRRKHLAPTAPQS